MDWWLQQGIEVFDEVSVNETALQNCSHLWSRVSNAISKYFSKTQTHHFFSLV
jgi:hypothetical protein